jgi:lysophospholipase L1-like esterase
MRATSSVVRRLFTPGSTESAPRRDLRTWSVRDAVMVGVITVGLLVLLEAGLRVADTIRTDAARWRVVNDEAFFSAHRRTPIMGWEHRRSWRGAFGGAERAFDASGHLTIDTEQLATRPGKRIVFLGDSNTFGFGVRTEESFAEVTERLLSDVHAINLAVSGYSSYQGRLVVERELAPLRPDAVVLSFNFNDRATLGEPDSAERFRRAYGMNGAAQTLARAAEMSYATRVSIALLQRGGLLPPVPQIDPEALRPRVDEDRYRDNLAAMIKGVQQAGAQVFLLVLGDNPIASHHLRQGVSALATDPQLAIGHLEVALTSTSALRELARIHLIRAYRMTGRTDKVAKLLQIKPAQEAYRMVRFDTNYHAIMREVGVALDVEVVEGVDALQPEHYIDICHFNAAGHTAVAAALAPKLARVLRVQRASRKVRDASLLRTSEAVALGPARNEPAEPPG